MVQETREKDIKNDNAVQPSSIDALGGGRARRGGGSHGLAQQGEDSSVEKQRYYSLTLLPPKGVPLHLLLSYLTCVRLSQIVYL